MEKIDNIVTVSSKLKEVRGFRNDEVRVLLLGDVLEIFEHVNEGLEVRVALEGQKKTRRLSYRCTMYTAYVGS